MPWKSGRRVLLILVGLFVGALAALALLPFWLSPLLKTALPHWGVKFAAYERFGYARFGLRDVSYKIGNVRVTAETLESDTPLVWVWRHGFQTDREIRATHWRVDVLAPEIARDVRLPPDDHGGTLALRGQLHSIAGFLQRWLPRFSAQDGEVRWQTGGLKIANATWQNRGLRVSGVDFGFGAIDATAVFFLDQTLTLDAVSPTQDWEVKLLFKGKNVDGTLAAWKQQAELSGEFDDRGWLPATLVVRAEKLSIPGDRLKLGDYYSFVHGAARVDWAKGTVQTSVDLAGEPLAGHNAPPLTVKMHGHGDTRRLTIETLAVDAPGISAKLDAPIELDRDSGGRSKGSVFQLTVDLGKQPWVAAQGVIAGEASVTPREGGWPTVRANLKGTGLKYQEWSGTVDTEATLEWPRLRVKHLTLATDQGDKVTFTGAGDLPLKELAEGELNGVLNGNAVARWLPAKVKFSRATWAIKAHGPLAALEHSGVLHVTGITSDRLKPTETRVTWRGQGPALEITEAQAVAGNSKLVLAGSIDANGAVARSLRLSQGGVEQLALAQTAAVHWSPVLDVEPVRLEGPAGSIEAAFTAGQRGQFRVKTQNVSVALLRDFLFLPALDWRIASLALDGQWDHGPMAFTVGAEVAIKLSPDRIATVSVAGRGDNAGLKIEKLSVAQTEVSILSATALIPVVISPGQPDDWVRFDADAPLDLRVDSVPNSNFWQQVKTTTGLDVREPTITARLSGTWRTIKGELAVRAARVAPAVVRFPPIEDLDLQLQVRRDGLSIDRFEAKVDGQVVRANGDLPLAPARWAEFREDPLTFIRKEANLSVEIPDAEVAAVARLFPAAIAPTGRLQLKMSLTKGGQLDGVLRLTDAASPPLGTLGVFQNIQADLRLKGDTVQIHSLTAEAGGRPLTVSGTIRLPLDAATQYDVHIKGEDLPFIRQTGLLLRGDIDLALSNPSGPPTVTGAVKLRESMFLSDLRAIIPHEGTSVPSRRPPFFSVETPPFNSWRLNIAVNGDRFLRLRSTVFVGLASAHFKLTGTLGDPRAVGEAVVDSGQVLLPFATMNIEQGSVRLTEADPHTLGLFITATARRYDYDLRMEISGSAAQPAVTFTSSPPLEPSQVLLLVMAGQAPHDEVVYNTAQRMSVLGAYLGQSLISSIGGDSSQAERMSISSGERISQQGRETYEIEYRLNDRFSLVGEYDEFDAYNAGVKYHLFAPEKQSKEKSDPAAKENKASKP